jgi:predicted O-methyltransferase YrrM
MSVYGNPALDNLVKIDFNHVSLIQSLVISHKPVRVLEMGFGSGEATRSILLGLKFNSRPFSYTVVDNWMDFGGTRPEATKTDDYIGIDFVSSGEFEFVSNCNTQFEFILSDADHFNTDKWFDRVYNNMLARDGILIYHDVMNTDTFPNLFRIVTDTIKNNYHHILLNKSSRPDERCGRGLLVIFKH